jgi:hypothetical protein
MTYIYYIDGEKFTTNKLGNIPDTYVCSPDEQTPAWENTLNGLKYWCLKGRIFHRLTAPAVIRSDGLEQFWLNGKHYNNIREWIKDHPNPDLYFDAIGLKTETDKVLWYLQN